MEVETNVSSSSARKQWRKGEVTDATARQLAAKQKKEFKPAPAPSPVEAYPMPSYDKTKTPPRDDQWRKENSDRRWQAWRRFPAEKQILLWRDLERSEREDYWKKMNVHERSTLWSHMTDEEKEMGWSTISENERQELCGNLMPGERSRWSSRLAKVSAAGETPAHQDKFKPAQPAPGYTPKSNFTEVE